MKEWEKELQIYRLDPAPPKKNDLQEYIALYCAEKPALIKELISAGLRNTQFIDFYRQYVDEDSEEGREGIAADKTYRRALRKMREKLKPFLFSKYI